MMHGDGNLRPATQQAPRFPLAERALGASWTPPVAPTTSEALATPQSQARSRRNWPLYLFLFLLPLQNIQTGYLPNFGGGINFLNTMFGLSLIGAWWSRGHLAQGEPVNRWVWAYALYSIVSLFVGYQYVSNTGAHFNVLKDHLLGVFLLYLVQMSVSDWAGVRRVVIAMLLPLPYIAKVVWVQHDSVSRWHFSDDLRIKGTFPLLGANEFAAFCVTVAVMLFALLIAVKLSRRWRIALLVGIASMVMGVLYAYSRTGYVSLILGLVVVVLAWRGRWKLMLPLLLAAALTPSLLPQSVAERFDSTTVQHDTRDNSTEMRFEFWQVAWNNFKEHPVLGTGFYSFHHREINPYGMDAHNMYMRTLTEGGIVGAVVVLGLLLSIFKTARRELSQARTGSWHYALALGLVGAWMAFVCGNLFGDRFTYYPVIAYFWAFVALVVKARHLPPEPVPGSLATGGRAV